MVMQHQLGGLGWLASLALVVGPFGCQAEQVTLPGPDTDETTGAAGAPATKPPPGPGSLRLSEMCAPRPEPEFGPYGYCSPIGLFGGEDYVSHCPGGGGGFSIYEGDQCGACRCTIGCRDEPCPNPGSGTVNPTCEDGRCILRCDDGETCPDGMDCVRDPDGKSMVCAWVSNTREYGSCLLERGEGCAGFKTKESCEGFGLSERTPGRACAWGTESIFSTSSNACEPVSVEEKCVDVELDFELWRMLEGRSVDETAVTHQCNERFVFWKDLGVGTASLLELDRCGYHPVDNADREYSPCEFGDPTIPLLCDCVCQ